MCMEGFKPRSVQVDVTLLDQRWLQERQDSEVSVCERRQPKTDWADVGTGGSHQRLLNPGSDRVCAGWRRSWVAVGKQWSLPSSERRWKRWSPQGGREGNRWLGLERLGHRQMKPSPKDICRMS